MKKILLTISTMLLLTLSARADEGMWLIQNINSALEKKMQGNGKQD